MKKFFSAIVIFISAFNIVSGNLVSDNVSKLRTVFRIESATANRWEDQIQLKLLTLNGKKSTYPKLPSSTNIENSYFKYLASELIDKQEKTLLVLFPESHKNDEELIVSFESSIEIVRKNVTALVTIFSQANWIEQKLYVNSIKSSTNSILEFLVVRLNFIRYRAHHGNDTLADLINELSQVLEESKATLSTAIETHKLMSSKSNKLVTQKINQLIAQSTSQVDQAVVVKQLGNHVCPECEEQRQSEIDAENAWQDAYIRGSVLLMAKGVALTVFCYSTYSVACVVGLLFMVAKSQVVFCLIWMDSIKTSLGKWI